MKTLAIAVVGTASLVASADAGFLGFVALAKQSGANVIVDIYTAVGNSSDNFLNVYNLNASTAGGFVQQAGLATKTWKPDAANFNSTRNSIDSFMTAGTYSGGAYGGEYYASTNTNGDPNFSGTSWNATPASPAATTIPNKAVWYTGDPTSVDNNAENMAIWAGSFARTNSTNVAFGGSAAPANSNAATHGIWIAHLVVSGNDKQIGLDFTFAASALIKDGVTGAATSARYQFTPSPSALALLSLSGLASRRRRS